MCHLRPDDTPEKSEAKTDAAMAGSLTVFQKRQPESVIYTAWFGSNMLTAVPSFCCTCTCGINAALSAGNECRVDLCCCRIAPRTTCLLRRCSTDWQPSQVQGGRAVETWKHFNALLACLGCSLEFLFSYRTPVKRQALASRALHRAFESARRQPDGTWALQLTRWLSTVTFVPDRAGCETATK